MRYSLDTLSGTWLGSYASQPVAQHSAVLVYCHHLGSHTHLVARLNDGELIPPST